MNVVITTRWGGDVQHGPGSSPFPALSGLPERVSSASSNEAQPANRSFVTSNAACHDPLHDADIAPGSFSGSSASKNKPELPPVRPPTPPQCRIAPNAASWGLIPNCPSGRMIEPHSVTPTGPGIFREIC